jgi:transglutaminase-like putative cysteine protease
MKLPAPLIYGLLLCILMVSAPHADHLPTWIDALCVMLLAWRAYLTRNDLPLPRRWLLLAITLGGIAGILIEYHTLFGREAGVTLLILLATLKQLELRTARDATVVVYLACFIVITNFFYSQSIPTALFMFATLLVIIATWLHLQTATLPLRPRLRLAATLLAQAVPLMLVLFVLFPRVPGPLWGMPQDAYASSGLTDTMAPGSISKLSLSDAVAFRVTFAGMPPLREQMYWRGPVLWDFDGQTWTVGKLTGNKPPQLDELSLPVDYTVTLEPHNKTWLFALDMPTRVSIPSAMGYDFLLRQRTPVNSRVRYNVHSQLGYRANAEEEPIQLRRALLLPQGLNPRARRLAEEWRAASKSDEAIMQRALRYFNQQGFGYTLEPPPLASVNGIDSFLFETRQGFCEHFASAFVFLMRAAGVPARVVTGYQGAEFNDLGGYYIVRQSDAHAWAEVWLPELGWARADPTAAVSPARVQSGLAAAVPDVAALPLMERTPSPWLRKLRFNIDAWAFQWNLWVLGYDTERQFAFLTRLGMEDVSWRKLAVRLIGLMALLIGLLALVMLRRLYAGHTDEVQRLYMKFCRKLEKHGITRAPHEGPQDFAMRAARLLPQHAPAITDITACYVMLRYKQGAPSDARQTLRRAITAFKL